MLTEPNIAVIGQLLSVPARASMLMALMDGRALPAGELAYCAHITPQTASSHLNKLVEAGMVTVMTSGRHRYYAISGPEIAQVLESLSTIAPPGRVRSLREGIRTETIRQARTCYDHLAGALGVALAEALAARSYLTLQPSYCDVTPAGLDWLDAWGIDVTALKCGHRVFARPCLDWSERRFHIAGALGAAITSRLFDVEWIVRIAGSRAVQLSRAGELAFAQEFGITIDDKIVHCR